MHDPDQTGQPTGRRGLGVGLRLLVANLFLLWMLTLNQCASPTSSGRLSAGDQVMAPSPTPTVLAASVAPAPTFSPTPLMPAVTLAPSRTPSPLPSVLPSATATPSLIATPSPTATPTAEPATPLPTVTAVRTAQPSPVAVQVREEQVVIPTYPYAGFVTQAWNGAFRISYPVLDRGRYEASNPAPTEVSYRALVLENETLRLTFLPELGGRLYELFYKPTGHRETYRNPVLKPSPWGPPEQGWWLAAGGIEWCLPVAEHGYEWGVPWSAAVRQDVAGVTVLLRDAEAKDRVTAEITVRLEAAAGYFTIRPRLENPTGEPLAVKYWTNAMLAPGGRNTPSAGLRFVLPEAVTAVTVHSRGDNSLPAPGQRLSWPLFGGVDLSRLGNWNRWLGFFEDPAVGRFVAVYDEVYDEGVVRVVTGNDAAVQGAKGFAFGWHDPIPASTWTDDSSSYVEIHSGPAATFDDSVMLPPRGSLQWTETWYPVAGLGALGYANEMAALSLTAGGEPAQAHLALAVNRPWSGEVVLLLGGQERLRRPVTLGPGQPFQLDLALGEGAPPAGRLTVRLEAAGGAVSAEYSTDL